MVSDKNKIHFQTVAPNNIALAVSGILLGNLAGIGFILSMDDALSQQIAAVLIRVFHAHISPAQFCGLPGFPEYISMFLLGIFVSPVIMSSIARRWIVLWGMVPSVVFCCWTTADYISDNSIKIRVSSVASAFLLNLEFVLIGVSLSVVVLSIKHHIFMRRSSR